MNVVSIKKTGTFLKNTAKSWSDDQALTLSAALAYYTIFSIAPLLLITLAVCGLFFGEEASRGEIMNSLSGLIGQDGAKTIEEMLKNVSVKESSIWATIIGVFTLLIGATGVFGQLQTSLNMIWRVKSRPEQGLWSVLRQRLLSFSLILVIAFLLLVSLVISAGLTALANFAQERIAGTEIVWRGLDLGLSFGITTMLFAAIYKILPDVKLMWKEVMHGAAFTALLFTIGKYLIGLYIGKSSISSTYGAAGSAVIIMLWTYYSTAILLFGAEYTRNRVLSQSLRRKIEPKNTAEWIKPQMYPAPLPGLATASTSTASSSAGSSAIEQRAQAS